MSRRDTRSLRRVRVSSATQPPSSPALRSRAGRGGVRVARREGLEPSTCGLEVRCSIQLSYRRILPGAVCLWGSPEAVPEGVPEVPERDGRGERIRTSDFLLPKQALCQTELRPAVPRGRVDALPASAAIPSVVISVRRDLCPPRSCRGSAEGGGAYANETGSAKGKDRPAGVPSRRARAAPLSRPRVSRQPASPARRTHAALTLRCASAVGDAGVRMGRRARPCRLGAAQRRRR